MVNVKTKPPALKSAPVIAKKTAPVIFDFEAFHSRMFNFMTAEMAKFPIDDLISMHNGLVDKYHETEGSDNEPPVTFALSVCDAAIMAKQAARFLN